MQKNKTIYQLTIEFLIFLSFGYLLFFYISSWYLYNIAYISAYLISNLFDMRVESGKDILLISNYALDIRFNFDYIYISDLSRIIDRVPLIFAIVLLFEQRIKHIAILSIIVFILQIITTTSVMLDSIFLYAGEVINIKAYISNYITSNLIFTIVEFAHKLLFVFLPYFLPMYIGIYLWASNSYTIFLNSTDIAIYVRGVI